MCIFQHYIYVLFNLKIFKLHRRMSCIYIDKPAKWKTRILRQLCSFGWSSWNGKKVAPVNCIHSSIVYRHDFLPLPTGSTVGTYVIGAISYRLPFCVLIYIGTLSMVSMLAGDLVQSRDFHYSVEPVYRRPREVVTYHREDSLQLNTYAARSRPGFTAP